MDVPLRERDESIENHRIRACKTLYYEGAHSINEIAEKMNMTNTEVFNATHDGRHYLTKEEIIEIKKLRETGLSFQRISKRFGVHEDTIRRRYNEGVNIFDDYINGIPLDDHTVNAIIRLYSHGNKSISEIANTLDISKRRVRYRLMKCGLHSPKFKQITKQEIRKFFRLRSKGLSISAIARQCDRDRATIAKYLHMK